MGFDTGNTLVQKIDCSGRNLLVLTDNLLYTVYLVGLYIQFVYCRRRNLLILNEFVRQCTEGIGNRGRTVNVRQTAVCITAAKDFGFLEHVNDFSFSYELLVFGACLSRTHLYPNCRFVRRVLYRYLSQI